MNKVTKSATDTFKEKGSKFIGHLFAIGSVHSFEGKLEALKSQYPDATHHCYAWRLDPTNLRTFTQDDGEPGGSAGLPILNQLKSYEVVDAGVVVVRYYGGTNLGKSGLIQAYSRAAENCLKKSGLQAIQMITNIKLTYPYPRQNIIDQLVHKFDLQELEATYRERVTLVVACPEERQEELANTLEGYTHLGIENTILGKGYL